MNTTFNVTLHDEMENKDYILFYPYLVFLLLQTIHHYIFAFYDDDDDSGFIPFDASIFVLFFAIGVTILFLIELALGIIILFVYHPAIVYVFVILKLLYSLYFMHFHVCYDKNEDVEYYPCTKIFGLLLISINITIIVLFGIDELETHNYVILAITGFECLCIIVIKSVSLRRLITKSEDAEEEK